MSQNPEAFPTIAVIGGGQMARALIGGWVARGADPRRIAVADPDEGQLAWLRERHAGLRTETSNGAAAEGAEVWLMAVKPQQLGTVTGALAPLAARQRPLVISIAAGIRSADLARWLQGAADVVRAMPNRPALIGAGASALYAAPSVSPQARALAARLIEAVGSATWVPAEDDIDAVTAVSGSGPAYFFLLIELLEAAGVQQGLAPDVARTLAIDTAAGAAALARQRIDDPATLRAQVTSKGGTTAAALAVFEAADLRGLVARAVAAAATRSKELAAEFGRDP